MEEKSDIWSEWLKHGRFGGDKAYQSYVMQQLRKIASEIVEKAEIIKSATVLDIGAGDGLVGLTALPKLDSKGKLILSDISEAALSIPMEIFSKKNHEDPRVEFLIAKAENLSPLPDKSVDRVVMRSVLLYVENKQAVFNEIFRVLKPLGIAVLLEPVNQRMTDLKSGLFRGYRLDIEPLLGIRTILQKVIDEFKRQMNHSQNTLLGYNEHDLVNMSINAGFEEIKLEYELERSCKTTYPSWEMFFDSLPNPRARSLRETMNDVLTHDEFEKAENILKEVIKNPSVSYKALAQLILKKQLLMKIS